SSGGAGEHGQHAVVGASAESVGIRLADRRCAGDTGEQPAEAEDRQAGCVAHLAAVARGAISQDLGTVDGGAGSAAVAEAPAHAGANADAGQEPVATHSAESGVAEEAHPVDGGGAAVAEKARTGALDEPPAGRSGGDVQGNESPDHAKELRAGGRRRTTACDGAAEQRNP